MEKLKFGAWLTHQWNLEETSATNRAVKKLAQFVIGDNSFPKVAISYSSYWRWMMKNTRGSDECSQYMTRLDIAWNMWELLLPEDMPETTKQAAIKE